MPQTSNNGVPTMIISAKKQPKTPMTSITLVITPVANMADPLSMVLLKVANMVISTSAHMVNNTVADTPNQHTPSQHMPSQLTPSPLTALAITHRLADLLQKILC